MEFNIAGHLGQPCDDCNNLVTEDCWCYRRPNPESEPRNLWEVLVPTIRNDGTPVRTRFHRVWDEKVRAISGGMTILTPAKGQWIDDDGQLYKERMIPVRILATRSEIEEIVDMTKVYYEQLSVLAYQISDNVILR